MTAACPCFNPPAGRRPDPMRPRFGDPVGPWTPHFAILPVDTVDAGMRWLCWVERRRIQTHDYLPGALDWWFQYRSKR